LMIFVKAASKIFAIACDFTKLYVPLAISPQFWRQYPDIVHLKHR
jgi:hypothetical protein